ncbi:RNA polymerase sigma factor [Stigmatella aurantiaca]|nr:sigma-70 family RNA polymerase sigma factor [Stigmatella aurantiaca]
MSSDPPDEESRTSSAQAESSRTSVETTDSDASPESGEAITPHQEQGRSSDALSDAELMHRIAQGDPAALTLLRNKHAPYLRTVLPEWCAEDIQQDVFEIILKSASTFDLSRPLRPWLKAIARNKFARYAKAQVGPSKSLIAEQSGDTLTSAHDLLEKEVDAIKLHEALAKLSTSDQKLLEDIYLEELDHSTVARNLNISPINLRVRLFRARKKLLEILTKGSKQ